MPASAPFTDQITDPAQLPMARDSHDTLARPFTENLVHIGDAARRASPQLGQGANTTLLAALTLARALRLANRHDALGLDAQNRRWHVRTYQAFTPQYRSDSRLLSWLRNRLLFPFSPPPPLPRILNALACGTLLPPIAALDRRP